MAKGIPTIPDPTMALIKLAVAPTMDDLLSWMDSLMDMDRLDPPGVSEMDITRGVDGAKNGLLSILVCGWLRELFFVLSFVVFVGPCVKFGEGMMMEDDQGDDEGEGEDEDDDAMRDV